uniref:KIB1-4 beta-propeller domain-containing protein n=1 Tax=Oryza meridionalis TaxID=40149 RepID=A0A0E0DU80_9ORYZ
MAAPLRRPPVRDRPPHPMRGRPPPHEPRLPLLARGAHEDRAPGAGATARAPVAPPPGSRHEHGLTFSCALSGWRRTHPFFLLQAVRRARCFGSYDGAWLFLAVDGQGPRSEDHVLVNLKNFQYIDLPNATFHFDWIDPKNVDIVAATLSRAPTEQGCIVAGIINSFLSHHQIAFWHMGDRLFSEAEQTVWLSPLEQVEDLLYLDEDFLLLDGSPSS